ncbi:MAG: hypothetical protein ABIR11_11790, partial [Candidatus Limnocylindrales bacterium]
MTAPSSTIPQPIHASAQGATRDRAGRFAVIAAVVGLWMGVGFALQLTSVPYLLVGIPITIAFQVLVARRPVRALWLLDARPFRLDRPAIALAIG